MEMYETCRGELATLVCPNSAEITTSRRNHSKSAFQDTRFTLEAVEITGWESLLPPAAS